MENVRPHLIPEEFIEETKFRITLLRQRSVSRGFVEAEEEKVHLLQRICSKGIRIMETQKKEIRSQQKLRSQRKHLMETSKEEATPSQVQSLFSKFVASEK